METKDLEYEYCSKCYKVYAFNYNSKILHTITTHNCLNRCMCYNTDRVLITEKEYEICKLLYFKRYYDLS